MLGLRAGALRLPCCHGSRDTVKASTRSSADDSFVWCVPASTTGTRRRAGLVGRGR